MSLSAGALIVAVGLLSCSDSTPIAGDDVPTLRGSTQTDEPESVRSDDRSPANASAEDAKIIRFQKGRTYYFASAYGNKKMMFSPEGRYESSSWSDDHGTWEQLDDGRLRLRSETKRNNITAGSLYAVIGDDEDIKRVRAVQPALTALLERPHETSFDVSTIRNLSRYDDDYGISRPILGVFSGIDVVPRSHLERFIAEVDAYVEADAAHISHITPWQFKNAEVLVDEDGAYDIVELEKLIDESHLPGIVMKAVDHAEYEKAAIKRRRQQKNTPRPRIKHLSDRPHIVRLAKEQSLYFRFIHSHPKFFSLSADGRYREVSVGHFGMGERDRGTWSQASDGSIKLISEQRLRDISSGPLQVSVGDEEQLQRVEKLPSTLKAYLESHAQDIFTPQEVEEIAQYRAPTGAMIELMRPRYQASKITRSDLEELLVAVDAYVKSSERNVFQVKVYQWGSLCMLESSDHRFDWEEVRSFLERGLDPYVYVEVTKAAFDESTKGPNTIPCPAKAPVKTEGTASHR